jgi:urea transport system ATP-binding protein
MIETTGLTLHYGGSQILHGIDFAARAGQVTCIMGTNGVGKTSFLKALAGSHPRSGGTVRMDGQDVPVCRPTAMAARGLALVPQGRMIFPLLTVQENLETAFALLQRRERRVPDEIYDLFPVLKDMAHRRGGDLSGGQQQQLAIARAMIMKPKVLLMDEPTEGIQPNIIAQIDRVISHLKAQGTMAIVLVEQYFDFAWGLADRLYVFERGKVTLADDKGNLSAAQVRGHFAL